jgi:hypothetical protein
VSLARHRSCYAELVTNYAFCRALNSVPLMAAEFASATLEYAIVFAGTEAVIPIAILGVRTDENLYITQQGGWHAKYIPAFVRRYPFVFSSRDEGKTFTLCIDEAFPGFNQDGRGERLFGEDGKPTPYVENVLKFLQQYQLEFHRTQAFCKKLKDLNLLRPMQAQVDIGSGERLALGGFSVVDRARLKTLSATVHEELVGSDALELIYSHLVSLGNFATIRDRLTEAPPALNTGGERAAN